MTAGQSQTHFATWSESGGIKFPKFGNPRNAKLAQERLPPPSRAGGNGEGSRGARHATEALEDTRNSKHSFPGWCRAKPHASDRRGNKQRWPRRKRRDVGSVCRKVRSCVLRRENVNLRRQGKQTGGKEKEHIHPGWGGGTTLPPFQHNFQA